MHGACGRLAHPVLPGELHFAAGDVRIRRLLVLHDAVDGLIRVVAAVEEAFDARPNARPDELGSIFEHVVMDNDAVAEGGAAAVGEPEDANLRAPTELDGRTRAKGEH